MRKLSTLLGVASFALGAFAALPTGTSFETSSPLGEAQPLVIDADDLDGIANERYWVTEAQGYELEADVTPYGDDGYDGKRPEKFADATRYNHLAVDGDAKPLYRAVSSVAGSDLSKIATLEKATTGIDDGLYIDTLVQFTVADEPMSATDAGVKFAIWTQTDETADEPTTNFVVRAGYFNTDGTLVSANYAMAAKEGFDYNAWHRLTVKAISDIGNGGPGFVVFVDGKLLNRADPDPSSLGAITLGNKVNAGFRGAVLPSMIGSGIYKNTISAVGFSGKGNVDDVSFMATAPEFATDSVVYSVTWGEGVAQVTCGDETIESSTEYPMPDGGTFQLVVKYEDGFMPAEPVASGVNITRSEAESSTGDGITVTYTFEKATTSGATIAFAAFVSSATLYAGGEISYHKTLADAFAAARSSGGTITLTDNAALDIEEAVLNNKDVTVVIDLAGKTITGPEGEAVFAIQDGNLVITNSADIIGQVFAGPDGGCLMKLGGGSTVIYGGSFTGAFELYSDDALADALEIYAGTFDKESWTDEVNDSVAKESEVYGPPVYTEYIVVAREVEPPEAPRYEFEVAEIEHATVEASYNETGFKEPGKITDLLGGTEVTVTYTPEEDYKIVFGEATKTYTVGEDGDTTSAGQVTVVAKDYVVSVIKGDEPVVKYESLQEAIDANEGEEFEATLLANIEEAVTIPEGTTLNLVEGEFTFSGTFAGAGTVAMTSAPKAASADRFAETWEGTFSIGWELKGASDVTVYGNANSTIEIAIATSAATSGNDRFYFATGETASTVVSTLKLSATVTQNNGWYDKITTIASLTGDGDLVIHTQSTGNAIPFAISCITNYSGTLKGNRDGFKIANIDNPSAGFRQCLVKYDGAKGIDVSATTLNNEPAVLVVDTVDGVKGIYLAAASVEIAGTVELFGSVENALDAAEAANAISVVVYDTASVVEREGWSYSEGVYTQTRTVAMVGETPYPSLAGAIEAAVAGGAAYVLLVDGTSEAVTIPEGITVSVADDVVFSGKLSGAGSIRYTKAPASFNKANLLAADWTGTYVADYDPVGEPFNPNLYGTDSSFFELAEGRTVSGYASVDITTKLRVNGSLTFRNGSSGTQRKIGSLSGSGNVEFMSYIPYASSGETCNYAVDNLEDWEGVLVVGSTKASVTNLVSGTGSVSYDVAAPKIWIGDEFDGTVTYSVSPSQAPSVSDGSECEVVIGYNWSAGSSLKAYGGANSTITLTSFTGANTHLPNEDITAKVHVAENGDVVINNGNPLGPDELTWDHVRVIQMPALTVDGALKLEKATAAGAKTWNDNYRAYFWAEVLDASGEGAIEVGNQFALRIDAVDFAKLPSGGGCQVPLSLTKNGDGKAIGLLCGTNGVAGAAIAVTVNGEATEKYLVYDAEKGGLVLEGAESELPTVDGEEVATEEVFDAANSIKDIVYPSEPALEGEEGSQTITFGGVTVDVPSYYTATLDGSIVSLKLNDNAIPEIGATEASGEVPAIPAMVVADDEVAVGLTSTDAKLWYGLATCDTPNGEYVDPDPSTLTQGTGAAMALTATREEGEAVKFYRVYVTDIAP